MSRIQAVIFDHSTLFVRQQNLIEEIKLMLQQLQAWGLKLVIFSTHGYDVDAKLSAYGYPSVDVFLTRADVNNAPKGSPKWVEEASRLLNIPSHQFLYVGDGEQDWRSAINTGVFFLYASWSEEYVGRLTALIVQSPRMVLMYATHFFLTPPRWQYSLDAPEHQLKIRILLEGNTRLQATQPTSFDLKHIFHFGNEAFVNQYSARDLLMTHALSSLYNEGLLNSGVYFTAYPGHLPDTSNRTLSEYLEPAAKFFHGWLKNDIIIRATEAKDSDVERRARRPIDFNNQTNTVHLNPEYASKLQNKTVVVFDDFTTHSMSLEWARNLLRQAGAKEIILMAIGKFVSRHHPSHNVYTPASETRISPFVRTDYGPGDFLQTSVPLIINPNASGLIGISFLRWREGKLLRNDGA